MSSSPTVIAAAAMSALCVGLLVYRLVPPPRSLGSRLRPYVAPAAVVGRKTRARGPLVEVFGPIVLRMADSVGRLLERSGDEVTILKLRQAGWYRSLPEEQIVTAYRVDQLRAISLGALIAFGTGMVLGVSLGQRVALVILGLVVGATRHKAKVGKAIERRRDLMRIEVYTIDQLLAMRVRAGGGVIQAVTATVQRGRGEVVAELADALRLHRAGWRAGDAFRRIAELTPEPFCGRTYRLLGTAEERGADLAAALLDLAEDVRETRRESMKRAATRRRAAMLIPTIAILAPVLILFVAAPLPSLITGWR